MRNVGTNQTEIDAGNERKLPSHPPSVGDLQRLDPPVVELLEGTLVWRAYYQEGAHPSAWNHLRHFGPVSGGRFDHHEPPPGQQERGVVYISTHGPTCILELFQETRTVDVHFRKPVLASWHLTRAIRLLDLTGHFPTQIGATQLLTTSGRRTTTQAYARAFHAAYPDLDGLYYQSGIAGGGYHSISLSERAAGGLLGSSYPALPSSIRELRDSGLANMLIRLTQQYGYALILDPPTLPAP